MLWSSDFMITVGIVTRCGPDGSSSNPGVGDIFHTVQTDPETHNNLLYNGWRVISGAKADWAWCWPPLSS